MTVVGGLNVASGDGRISSSDHLHGGTVDMADRVRPWSHGCIAGARHGRVGGAVLPGSALARSRTTGTLATVAGTRRRCGCLVEFLLMS
jgi:hypothetical protein